VARAAAEEQVVARPSIDHAHPIVAAIGQIRHVERVNAATGSSNERDAVVSAETRDAELLDERLAVRIRWISEAAPVRRVLPCSDTIGIADDEAGTASRGIAN